MIEIKESDMSTQSTSTCTCNILIDDTNEIVVDYSTKIAAQSVAVLWGLVKAQYPKDKIWMKEHIKIRIIDELNIFAINARKAIDISINIQIKAAPDNQNFLKKKMSCVVRSH